MILLTGSTGFLGTRIAEELGSRSLAWRPLGVRLDRAEPADVEGAVIVIHCAGLVPGRSAREREFFEVNTEGTARLLQACTRAGVRRFVNISSMGVKIPSA